MGKIYNFTILSTDMVEKIYNDYMINDFHSNELKPLSVILKYINAGFCNAYGMFLNDNLIAYGFVCLYCNAALLDYYAVIENYRGNGYGSRFISYLNSMVDDGKTDLLIAEVENPDFSGDNADKQVRERRVSFYAKNKLLRSNLKCTLFGSHYNIWYYMGENICTDDMLFDKLNSIYHRMFNDKLYEKNVFLTK